ncbi:hypothetical protein HOA55_04190 [archaeon]|jgi:hypothetical protein|nr:hypothetical protein [archaeon]MBT3577925.1 hypothetical protein [archaeon]MBT6820528.1 hypothetical protein [archaeon]MBT7025778.1 hypothetical protein [archaeon]MBT7238953.1 hypothetical protein [archaeon]
MAKKKKVDEEEELSDLRARVRELKYEDDDEREKTIKEALASGKDDILAPIYFHLGVNEKKYSVAIDYLTRAREAWRREGHAYYVRSAEKRISMRKEEEQEKRNSLVGRVKGWFKKAA